MNVRLILFPTGFSPNCQQAFEAACSLAKDYGAQLRVMHVDTDSALASLGGMPEGVLDERLKSINEALRRCQLDAAPLPTETLLVQGLSVADSVVAAAVEENADLIVMGAGSRSGLGRSLFAGVTEKVIRSAPCPVITVKPTIATARSVLFAEPAVACGAL